MPVRRLNHAVLFVRDVEASVAFYGDVLGFAPIEGMDALKGAAFLRAPASTNDHDLGLFEIGSPPAPRVPVARRSASTTSPGRSRPSPISPRSRRSSPSAARSPVPPTTAPPRRSTARIRTASSSK